MGIDGGRRWLVGAGIAAVVVFTAASCAQQSDLELVAAAPEDFAATPEFLGEAVSRSTEQSFRYEMTMAMHIGAPDEDMSLDFDLPFAHGAQDGNRYSVAMDFGELFQAMADDVGGGEDLPFDPDTELGMEAVGDTETMYMRAPFFSVLAEEIPSPDELEPGPGNDDLGAAVDLFEVFAGLGDRWARIDLTALNEALPGADANAMPTGDSFDPMALFEVVAGSDQVEDLGTSEIDGVPVTGLAATVSLADLQQAQGVGSSTVGLPTVDAPEREAVAEALADVELPIEAWIDGEGLVRRIQFTFGVDQVLAAAEAAEQVAPDDDFGDMTDAAQTALDEFEMRFGFDFSDYGDDSIDIQFPEESDTVDVTEAYVDALSELAAS